MKDPENINPKFKPDLSVSQEIVSGKKYEQGFDSFLKEMNTWKERKDKKLRDKLKENDVQQMQFKPHIS